MQELWNRETEEKKVQLLKAALAEFSEKGYQLASTNQIVKQAGSSKGILFHYFGTKKNLYLYLIDLCIEHFLARIKALAPTLSSDLLHRMLQIHQAKMALFHEEPQLYHLAVTAFIDPAADELQTEMKERESGFYARYLPLITEGIDRSLFRDEVDGEQAFRLLYEAVESLEQKYVRTYREQSDQSLHALQAFTTDLQLFLDMLRHGLYHR